MTGAGRASGRKAPHFQQDGPGSAGHIRICLATSHEILEEGLNRLEKGLRAIADRKK